MSEPNDPRRVTRRTKRFEGHALTVHRHTHPDPSHHIGACSPDDRAGRAGHVHREGRHLYAGRGASSAKADFIRRYGKKRGGYIYGATVAKVKRQQLANRRRARGAAVGPRGRRRRR